MRRILKPQGQTSVEYMLILVVAITIGMAFKQKMEEFMISNPNSFISRQSNAISAGLQEDSSGRYRRFSLR